MHVDQVSDVLLVVDMQRDFLPGGVLAVPDGDAVIAPISRLIERFANVVLTQDWHPPGHVSFASSHPGRSVHERVLLEDGREQVLWPDHCLQGSKGAGITAELEADKAQLVVRKGFRPTLDSYSAFVEADGTTQTGLAGYLRQRGIVRVFVVGLAVDFCAGWTAIDAARAGFETFLVEDATRGIDVAGSVARALAAMEQSGVTLTRMSAF